MHFLSVSPVTAVCFRGRHWSCIWSPGSKDPVYVVSSISLCSPPPPLYYLLLNLLLLNILETELKGPLFCIHSGTAFSGKELFTPSVGGK